MDYKKNKPFDSRNDEEKDWQQRLRDMSLEMGNGAGKPGEIRRPGVERQPDYSLMTASNENQHPVSDAPASGGGQSGDAVQQAQQMLEQNITQSSGSGVPSWQEQLDETLKQILNRKDFSYDLNGDALYQQYKDQYMLQGQQAMMDTMGQAAAMTGGYGNSYAQSVGQQAYNSHIQQLNNRIPELYSLALSKYQNEGDALLDRYAILGAERDFAEDQRRYDQEWEQEYGDSSGGSSGGGSNGGYSNGGVSVEAIKQIQRALGVTADGVWGPKSRAAAGGLSADEAWKLYNQGQLGEPTEQPVETQLSEAGQRFMNSLPHPHSGSDVSGWKQMVRDRLDSSSLSDEDKIAIAVKLGLY